MLADCEAKVMQLSSQLHNYEDRDSQRQQRFDEEVKQCREKYHNKVAELMKNSQSRESELQREIAQIKDGYLKMEVDMKQVSNTRNPQVHIYEKFCTKNTKSVKKFRVLP